MPDYVHSGPGAGFGTKDHCKTLTSCGSAGCTVNIAATPCSQGTSPSDWGEAPYYSSQFNQIYYNPDISYEPGVDSTGTSLGNSNPAAAWADAYLDQSSANAKTLQNQYPDIFYCMTSVANATALATTTMCVRNGRDNAGSAVGSTNYFLYWSNTVSGAGPRGAYPSGSSTGNAFRHRVVSNTGNPYYFKIAAHEYCSDENLTVCQLATSAGASPGGAFTIPAPVRFCSLAADAASTAVVSGTHQTTSTSSTPAGSTSLSVSSTNGFNAGQSITITLDDGTIFTSTISSVGSSIRLATAIPSGRFVPNSGAIAGAAKCQRNFRVGTHEIPRYGRFTRTDITSSTATYAKSATAVRPDCGSGPTCTYEQELQNFANWYSYYRIRMSLMKTATGRAFRTIDDRYRVGFITINPTSSTGSTTILTKAISPTDVRYLPIATFNAAQKLDFYEALYSQDSHGNTPLRRALSRVGRHYAGKTDGINT
jgi:type IV pilus assembly protein PilY1